MLEAIDNVGYAAILTGHHPGYHVIVECGTQTSISKSSSGGFYRDFSLLKQISFLSNNIGTVQEIWTKSTGTKSSCSNCQNRSWKL